jgi:hypothetical protein
MEFANSIAVRNNLRTIKWLRNISVSLYYVVVTNSTPQSPSLVKGRGSEGDVRRTPTESLPKWQYSSFYSNCSNDKIYDTFIFDKYDKFRKFKAVVSYYL